MSLNRSVYIDGTYEIVYQDTYNLVRRVRETVDSFRDGNMVSFNPNSSNSITTNLPEGAAAATKFSMTISDEFGNQKLNVRQKA